MGVRGLTSYIYSKEHIFFDSCKLEDCTLIIDGNGLCYFLYNQNLIYSSAFGGDYDKLAVVYEAFLKCLIQNNVYPIIVFDGGAEKRKLNTIISRARDRVMSLHNITPMTANARCSPIMMRKVMREQALDMGLTIIQADFEADDEIAALAKTLGVPVLAEDSDFFIFDVQYIPITKTHFGTGAEAKINCKLFRMDKFLRYSDLDRDRLSLLAILLGNDYIRHAEMSSFMGQIKLGRSRKGTYSAKVIAGVMHWLKSESAETALKKILSCIPVRAREALERKMRTIMLGYAHFNSELIDYIDTTRVKTITASSDDSFCVRKLVEEIDKMENITESESEDETVDIVDNASSFEMEGYDSDSQDVEDADISYIKTVSNWEVRKMGSVFPDWLKDRSRRGLVSSEILSLLNIRSFFSTPQVECYEMPWSGEPYLRVLQCVAGLLLGPADIHCWYRQHRNKYEATTIRSICETSVSGIFPSVENIGTLSSKERLAIFNDVMENNDNSLAAVPDDWKLYLVSVRYWLKKDSNYIIKSYHLHAVIFMMIILPVIDGKIGHHRIRKTYIKTYGGALKKISRQRVSKSSNCFQLCDSITSALQLVTREDCILIFDELLPFLQLDKQTQCSKNFSSHLIHSFAQLQACLLFTSFLNNTLADPYPDLKIHKFYNGTFLYNMAVTLKKKADILSYIASFLGRAPTLLSLYHAIFDTLKDVSPTSSQTKPRKKKKSKNVHSKSETEVLKLNFDSDPEPFFDGNNRFCSLNRI